MNDLNSSVTPRQLSLSARLKSFGYALQGIAFMLKTQHNAWLHGVATLAVIALAVYCGVSASDWRWLIVAMGMVWVGETINTAVEYVCDVVSPENNHAVKHAKDIAAGGVLIAAVASLVIGALTFYPYFC
jgi:diacylglycerol kinase (ATP)